MEYKSIFDKTSTTTKTSTAKTSGYVSIFDKKKDTKVETANTIDVNDIEGLKSLAKSKGLEVKEKKPSLFTRAMDILSRPTYASAGAAKALVKGNENPLTEAWKGLTGQEKETYSDVLSEAGVKNKFIKGVVGFALDVALDPTTYFGGAIAKGIGKTAQVAGKGALETTRFFNPTIARRIEVAGTGIKDALGEAFVPAYKTTAGISDEITIHLNKLGMATDDIIRNVDEAFKSLPKEQHKEFAETLLAHRKKIIDIEGKVKQESLDDFNKLFGGKRPVTGVRNAEQRFGGAKGFEKKFETSASNLTGKYQDQLNSFTKKIEKLKKQREIKLVNRKDLLEWKIGENVSKKTSQLTQRLENVLKDELNLFTGDLTSIISNLKKGVVKQGLLKGSVADLAMPLKNEFDDIVKSALGPMRDDLEEAIRSLQQEVMDSSGKEFLKKGIGFDNPKEAVAKMLQDKVIKTQNDYNKLVFEMEDKIKQQINAMRAKIAQKMELKQKDITSKIIKIQNETSIKKNIAEKFFTSRSTAKSRLNKLEVDFKTPEQKAFFNDKYKKIIDDMAESTGLPEKERFAAYFPSIDETRLKSPTSGRIASLSDESYKKLYKGINENELKKPIEALARTQAKIFRDNLSKETLDSAVTNYGKPLTEFANELDAAKAGYKLIKDKQFGKGVGYLKEADFNYINNYLYPDLKIIDTLAKASGYDAFTRLFKTAVTSWFPAFHIRNAISGTIQNYQALGARAFDPSNIPTALAVLKGADKQIKLGGKIYNTKALQKVLQENFGKTSRYVADLGDYIEELTDGSFKLMSKINQLCWVYFIEKKQKATAMVIALKQGKTIKEAVKLAETAGFNYQKLTKFEAKVMRRLIPFYSFMRKNAELQLKTLSKNPERILNQKKFADMLSNSFGEKVTEEDLEGVPPWALQGLGFKLKDNKYVSSLGLPLEEFFNRVNNPMMSTLSSMNPIIKYNLEAKMGYDFFRERKILDLNSMSPVTGKILFDAQEQGKIPEYLSQAINIKKSVDFNGKDKYTMSPKALHRLRSIPTARFQNTFEKIFDKDIDSVQKMTALFSGGKIYEIDQEKQKYFTERDMKRDLEDWLLSIGEGKKFEKFYIPKEKEAK